MQNTSATWKTLAAALGSSSWVEAQAVIDGVTYTEITPPVITRALTQNGLSVGNVVSACCDFTVRTSDTIAKSATVLIQMRITNGTSTSEWLPAGTFYVARRATDPVAGTIALQCFDALLKANAEYEGSATWPCAMDTLATEIATTLGVTVDSRTVIATGAAYTVTPDENPTLSDLLGLIGAANGGNWIMTPAGELRLVPIVDAADAASAAVAVDVLGVTGGVNVGATDAISGIRYEIDGQQAVAGAETGLVVDAHVSLAVAALLLNALGGMYYQSFALAGAIYDPAAELGDYVRAGANGEIRSALYAETATLGPAFRGDLSAPVSAETEDEYPYIGGASRKAYNAAITYAKDAVATLDGELDQTGVFNRLTNNGALPGLFMANGQLYINASYIYSGMLTLGGLNNENGTLVVKDANRNTIVTLNNDGAQISDGTITNYNSGRTERVVLDKGRLKFEYEETSGQSTYWEIGVNLARLSTNTLLYSKQPITIMGDHGIELDASAGGSAQYPDGGRITLSNNTITLDNLYNYNGQKIILAPGLITIQSHSSAMTFDDSGNLSGATWAGAPIGVAYGGGGGNTAAKNKAGWGLGTEAQDFGFANSTTAAQSGIFTFTDSNSNSSLNGKALRLVLRNTYGTVLYNQTDSAAVWSTMEHKSFTGTTTASGNINLDLDPRTYVVYQVLCTTDTRICSVFKIGNAQYAHIVNASTGAAITSTSVTLHVFYAKCADNSFSY